MNDSNSPAPLDLSQLTEITSFLQGPSGTVDQLNLDNLWLVNEATVPRLDWPVHDAAPPPDETLDTIAIANPLQERAWRFLNRGYNITNWLEQYHFSGFTYDESFVAKLAAAGFASLRLPIDLDRYVVRARGTPENLSLEIDPELFTILDAFEGWTRKHGLSLTIDYHQYSSLLDKDSPESIATAVELWGEVARHFADNAREDLFFELVNEPELSFSVAPSASEWRAIAERMVERIRAFDTRHSIIFGATEWYGIHKLIESTPLDDANVIYAFHAYQPFVFTHQGAAWAGLGSTHDIPYPYDPSRWPGNAALLGFNRDMPAWVLDEAQRYYRTGNRPSLRNEMASVKRWAIRHDVPVICNEFGALDRASGLEDRARYYTDLVSIFEELQIPWQHWFMVMTKDGQVAPEYREALGLHR